ncbi:MAG: RluA family pseudouridine synthase [Treponemataceae bacterium]
MPKIELAVENLKENIRLDSYVAQNSENFSRSRLKNGTDCVYLNDKKAKFSTKVKNGDKIFLEWTEPIPEKIEPENIFLNIIYEDKNVCVVNKKQGMVTHPACGNWNGTLVNALLFHCKKTECTVSQRPGIVHRLDKDTTGTIICAKNVESELWLQKQFKDRRVKKEYIAIVKGIPKEKFGNVKVNMIRDPKNRKRFTVTKDSQKGKFSHTVYSCIASYGPYSLMKLRLKTGRTHQIRVHMKYLGCPILGDSIYGTKDKIFDSATLMLHSSKMSIRLPNSNTFSVFKSPTPVRFLKVLKFLHQNYEKIRYKDGKRV